ncbi:hypothetical protein GCM10027446_29000 [Angustibacter peucedani]
MEAPARPSVHLQRGDVLAQQGDVLVLPCTTDPDLGEPWLSVLFRWGIVRPDRAMALGEVVLEPAPPDSGYGSIAFAATLGEGSRSSVPVVNACGTSLGRLTADRPLTVVTPLLGTGVGRLDAFEAARALAIGFQAAATPGSVLLVVVKDESHWTAIQRREGADLAAGVTGSYSWTTSDSRSSSSVSSSSSAGVSSSLPTEEIVEAPSETTAEATAEAPVEALAAVLRDPPLPGPTSWTAAYAADTADRATRIDAGTDPLGIVDDVRMLASVIASRHITPPLSVGIFGDWGSGKSYLMNQLRLQVRHLSDEAASAVEADPDPARRPSYHSRIAQVEFNAWQYAGGELWPSLINRVFEGIRDHFDDDARYQKMIDELASRTQGQTDAEAELHRAERALQQQGAATTVQGVATSEALRADAKTLEAAGLGGSANLVTLADEVAQLRSLGGQLSRGWRAHRGWVVLLGLAALVLVGALVWVVSTPSVSRWVAAVGAAPVVVVGGVAVRWVDRLARAGLRILAAGQQEALDLERARAAYAHAQEAYADVSGKGSARVYSFVKERYAAEDYRKYLGLVPLIRDDLATLSRHVGPDAEGDGEGELDRVVLYVDDLDRCSSEQVVHVLEAVNLLFGLPLFVVVIAVDSRWLLRSLEQRFVGVLSSRAGAPSAQDYLEKIIQIPFWLRPMGSDGFSRLVGDLARASVVAPSAAVDPRLGEASDHAGSAVASDGSAASAAGAPAPEVADATQTGPAVDDDEPGSAWVTRYAPPGAPSDEVVDLWPQTLQLTEAECDFLDDLGPLVRTPRAAKRLVNTYQLTRVQVQDLDAFVGEQQYRPLMLLLALVTSSPGLTADMAHDLVTSGAPHLEAHLRRLNPGSTSPTTKAWAAQREALATLPCECVTPEALRRWLPLVSRFSFQTGLAAVVR